MLKSFSVDVSDVFNFFCSGEGKGESEAPERGGNDFLLKVPKGGGLPGGPYLGAQSCGLFFSLKFLREMD